MSEEKEGTSGDAEAISCKIVLRGELSSDWAEWFQGLETTVEPGGYTLLSGVLEDQAALHGVLRRIRDIGIPLISVTCEEARGGAKGRKKQMQAILFDTYGGPEVLRLGEAKRPVPKEKEVLIQVRAAAVNAADWHVIRGEPLPVRFFAGLLKPKYHIPGCDVAGVVRAVGSEVTRFRVGDEVFGDATNSGWGGFAEYVAIDEQTVARKPENASFEEAAALPTAGATALQGLRDKGGIKPGDKVLINGASGGVGTFAVQLAKHFGAAVTGVCSSSKVELVRSIGADEVIDYTREDFAAGGAVYDLILAANGSRKLADYRKVLGPRGRYVQTGGGGNQLMEAMLLGPMLSKKKGQQMGNILMKPNARDLELLAGLLGGRKVVPVVDRSYSLKEVPEAIGYLEEGHARGKVIISITEA